MKLTWIILLSILFLIHCCAFHTHEEGDIQDVIDYYEDKIEEELKCPEETEVECFLCHDNL